MKPKKKGMGKYILALRLGRTELIRAVFLNYSRWSDKKKGDVNTAISAKNAATGGSTFCASTLFSQHRIDQFGDVDTWTRLSTLI